MAERTEARRGRGKVSESELGEMKVDELRQLAKDRGVGSTSAMRKDELVKAITRTYREGSGGTGRAGKGSGGQAGGVRHGPGNSKSLRYAQEITSPEDEPERAGRSLVTTNHEVIKKWAEERGAVPATVQGSEHAGHLGVLRFDFPPGDSDRLRQVSWDEWFATFDERRLNFIYQEERSDGRQSNFFRLENPQREDA